MDTGLLTPTYTGHNTWGVLFGFLLLLVLSLYQVSCDPLLADSVEMSVFHIILSAFNVYHSGLAILRLMFAAVASFVKKYGLKRSFLYITFITGLACLIVYLLDVTTIKTTSLLKDKIVRRFEDSIVEIEEKRGPIKQRHMTGVEPYSIEEHTKYNGEDVVFECYRLVSFPQEVSPPSDPVVWEKNGEIIHPSDNVNITWSFENVTDNEGDTTSKYYLISSTLNIIFIDRSDYGNYSCHVKNWAIVQKEVQRYYIKPPLPRPEPQPQCPLKPPPLELHICFCICPPPPPPRPLLEFTRTTEKWKTLYQLVKVFSLVRMKAHVRVVHAPPGGIVSFSATYDHLADVDDVIIDYRIGGDPFEKVCGWSFGGCSMSVAFYWQYLHRGGHSYIFQGQHANVRMRTAVTGTGWLCVCMDAYDFHEFRFLRRMYNASSGREELWEVKYPHSILLAPRTPDLFFQNFTNRVDPLARPPCWANQKEHMTHSCKQEVQGVEWVFWLYLRFELIVINVTALAGFALAYLAAKLTMKLIVIPFRNKILENSFRKCSSCCVISGTLGSIKEDVQSVKHAVFISHANDQLVSSKDLRDLLRNYGVRTFLADEDILGGQLKLEAISDAISLSDRYIVILSKGYIESGRQNHFEFQLILQRILERKNDDRKLLILRRDDSRIPEVLNRFCILDWRENRHLEDKCWSLKKWVDGRARGGEICAC